MSSPLLQIMEVYVASESRQVSKEEEILTFWGPHNPGTKSGPLVEGDLISREREREREREGERERERLLQISQALPRGDARSRSENTE